jgi:hypothetical protein
MSFCFFKITITSLFKVFCDLTNQYINDESCKYLCGAKLPEYLIKNKEPWYRELEHKWQQDLKGKCDS